MFVLERGLQVLVALPGVRADEFDVELSSSGLRVSAESHLPRLAHQARIVRLEIPYGRIERRIELPPGRYELLSQELLDGCLRIRLAGEWL
jgi:HSP20 family molecular chaperone IbpA